MERYKQIHYVKVLREVLVELSETNPQMVQNLLKDSPFLIQIIGNVFPVAHARRLKNPPTFKETPGVGYYGSVKHDPVSYMDNCTEQGRITDWGVKWEGYFFNKSHLFKIQIRR